MTPSPDASSPAATPPAAATSPNAAEQAVAAWARAGGSSGLANLSHALDSASQDALDPAALATACQQVSAAITSLAADGPVPYQPAESWLAKALAELSTGASECHAGVQAGNVSMEEQAVIDVSAGATYLGLASSAIHSLMGTTSDGSG